MYELPLRQTHGANGSNSLMLYEGVRIAGRFVLGRLIDGGIECASFEGYDLHTESWVRVRFRLAPTFRDLRLAHPGIGQFHDHGCVGDWYVSSQNPGEGEGLDLFVARTGHAPVDFTAVVGIGLELLTLLDLPHHTGAYHGNLALSSLHVTPDWGVQIVDFPDRVIELTDSAIPFASPERQVGHSGDERSDVYASAGILYNLFTGRAPFGEDPVAARHGHLYERLAPDPHLPEPLFTVLETAMAKRPDHRYPTAEGLCSALRDAFMEISLGFPELTLENPDYWDLPQVRLAEPHPAVFGTTTAPLDPSRFGIEGVSTLDPAPQREAAPPRHAAADTPGFDWGAALFQAAVAGICLVSCSMAACASTVAVGVYLFL